MATGSVVALASTLRRMRDDAGLQILRADLLSVLVAVLHEHLGGTTRVMFAVEFIEELALVPWIAGGRVLYWGDLDTYGFRILSLLRQALPSVESILMDQHTLERYSSLTVTEPSPYRGDITHLTRSENDALRELRLADLRLEQERIDIQYAERVVCGSCS